MGPHLTVEQRQLALRLKARGLSLREIGPQVGCAFRRWQVLTRLRTRSCAIVYESARILYGSVK
jgi:hypothetical protein